MILTTPQPIVTDNILCTFLGQSYSRQIAIHPNSSGVILVNYPGADGNIDGYKNKYGNLAEHLAQRGLAAVIRIDNPASWGDQFGDYEGFLVQGVYDVVQYARSHAQEICGRDQFRLWLMGFSAGASAIAVCAQDAEAEKILLMAPAGDAGVQAMFSGIEKFVGDVSIVLGDRDHIVSVESAQTLYRAASRARSRRLEVIPNCDHQFRGTINGQIMSKAPLWAFGEEVTFPSPEGGLILY